MSKKIKKFVPNRHPREGHLTAASKLFCGKTLYLFLILFLSIALFAGLIFTVENGEKVFLREEEVIAASGNWTDSGNYDTNWSGSGTESDPYIIEGAADLAGLAATCSSSNNYRDKYFQQIGSIDLSAHYWKPIDSFGGHYDGGQNTISGMTISSSTSHAGLFGSITGIEDNLASVKKIGIVDTTIYGVDYVGSVAGSAQFCKIEYCYNKCDIEPSGDHVGGIVGLASLNTTISYCYNTGDITIKGEDYGGIVGLAGLAAIVTNCYNRGMISTGFSVVETRCVGGIIGNGGLVAGAFNCYNTGTVSVFAAPAENPGEYLGGICGAGGAFSCFNIGSITTFLNFNLVAGICADTVLSEASYCYNLGLFTSGAEAQAAIVANGNATGCYYGGDCRSDTGGYSGGDGEGAKYSASLNKNNFKSQSYMTSSANWDTEYLWDFTNIWEFRSGENDGYPVLKKLAYNVTFDAEGGNVNYADALALNRTVNYSNGNYTYTCASTTVTYDLDTHTMTLNGTGNGHIDFPSATNLTFKQGERYQVLLEYVSGSTSGRGDCMVIEVKNGYNSLSTRNHVDYGYVTSSSKKQTVSINVSSLGASQGTSLIGWFWFGGTNRTFSNYKIKYQVIKVNDTNSQKTLTVKNSIGGVSVPFKEGYVFKGYYSSPNGQGTKYFSETGACLIQPGADMKLYAYWEDTWLNHAATSFAGGSGTQNDPYQIATASQLALLAKNVYNGTGTHTRDDYIYEGVYFKQTADIDLSQYKWVPIGVYYNLDYVITDYNFSGIYNGMGYTISGIKLPSTTGDSTSRRGLFGVISGSGCSVPCQILNVNVKDSTISGGDHVGGIVGYARANTIITNCSVNATVTGSSHRVGMIVGGTIGTSVTNCAAQGSVSGVNYTGGIVGYSEADISNCSVDATITGTGNCVGGIVGNSTGTSVTNCEAYGSVTGVHYTGGIMGNGQANVSGCSNYAIVKGNERVGGMIGNGFNCSVTGCFNFEKISGSAGIAGIVGLADNVDILRCYNLADISGNYGGGIGGRITNTTTIKFGVNTGKITSVNYAGGIAGDTITGSTITQSLNLGDIVSSNNNAGGILGSAANANVSTITNCYSNCNISASSCGALVGGTNAVTISYCAGISNTGSGFYASTSQSGVTNSYVVCNGVLTLSQTTNGMDGNFGYNASFHDGLPIPHGIYAITVFGTQTGIASYLQNKF